MRSSDLSCDVDMYLPYTHEMQLCSLKGMEFHDENTLEDDWGSFCSSSLPYGVPVKQMGYYSIKDSLALFSRPDVFPGLIYRFLPKKIIWWLTIWPLEKLKTHFSVGMVSFGLAHLESYSVRILPLPMVSRVTQKLCDMKKVTQWESGRAGTKIPICW